MDSEYKSSYASCPQCGHDDIFGLGKPVYIKQDDSKMLATFSITSSCNRCRWKLDVSVIDSINNFFKGVTDSIDKAVDSVKDKCVYETKINFVNINGNIVRTISNCEFLSNDLVSESDWLSGGDEFQTKKRPSTPKNPTQYCVKVKIDENQEEPKEIYIPYWAIESLSFSLPNICEGEVECKSLLEISLLDNTENVEILNSPKALYFC